MKELNKNNGFKTPEAYFEKFSHKLMNKLSEEQTVLPKDSGFTVPNEYFDNLNSDIQYKLNKETKVVQLNSYKKLYWVAASSAAVVLLFFGLNQNTENQLDFNSLAHSEIENYFDSNEIGLYIEDIAEVLPVDELEIKDIVNDRLNDENLVDYLHENTDDLEELNLEDYE